MITLLQGSAPYPKSSRLTLRPINTSNPMAEISPRSSIQGPQAWLNEHSSGVVFQPLPSPSLPIEGPYEWLKENTSGTVSRALNPASPLGENPYEFLNRNNYWQNTHSDNNSPVSQTSHDSFSNSQTQPKVPTPQEQVFVSAPFLTTRRRSRSEPIRPISGFSESLEDLIPNSPKRSNTDSFSQDKAKQILGISADPYAIQEEAFVSPRRKDTSKLLGEKDSSFAKLAKKMGIWASKPITLTKGLITPSQRSLTFDSTTPLTSSADDKKAKALKRYSASAPDLGAFARVDAFSNAQEGNKLQLNYGGKTTKRYNVKDADGKVENGSDNKFNKKPNEEKDLAILPWETEPLTKKSPSSPATGGQVAKKKRSITGGLRKMTSFSRS